MECGHEKTCVVPIVKGEMMKDFAIITDIAGLAVQNFLKKLLQKSTEQTNSSELSSSLQLAFSERFREAKENLCEVKSSLENAMNFYGFESLITTLKIESSNKNSFLNVLPSELLTTISKCLLYGLVRKLLKSFIIRVIIRIIL